MPKLLLTLAMLIPTVLSAQVAHRTGSVHTREADLGYEAFGTGGCRDSHRCRSTAVPGYLTPT